MYEVGPLKLCDKKVTSSNLASSPILKYLGGQLSPYIHINYKSSGKSSKIVEFPPYIDARYTGFRTNGMGVPQNIG